MTIASHCLALLHERGPLTAEELGAACRDAGVTTSKNPAQSVTTALSWNQDGRALLIGDRFHPITQILEGRWLTFLAPVETAEATLDVDLACLTHLVEREGLPLAGGGSLKTSRYSYDKWKGPDGWLPDGEILGLRLVGGTAQVSAVVIDDVAQERGKRLAALLTGSETERTLHNFERIDTAGKRLLLLLAEHDDLLREPVPPLSVLLPPSPEVCFQNSWQPPSYWSPVKLYLPPGLRDRFDVAARALGEPFELWLSEQLAWLADSPLFRLESHAWRRAMYDDQVGYVNDDRERWEVQPRG